MIDLRPTRQSWLNVRTHLRLGRQQVAIAAPSRRIRVLRRLTRSLPRELTPLLRRGLNGVSAHLPTGMRHRLFRLLISLSREMGGIERHYADWIARHDCMDAVRRRAVMAGLARMPRHPRISIVMPVYNPSPAALLAAIQSVQDQIYSWWELCIADDASTNPDVIRLLRDVAAADDRIRLLRRESNGHISAASNSALRLATGEFVALMDHDDILPPHALFEIASCILARPTVDLIYSDEDHLGADGRRHHPYFKPDWDPDLVLAQNLVSHLGVYRRTLLERIGGFRTGLEGSQDHDLALRAAQATTPDRIAHIPKVLYHWRQGASDHTYSEAAHDRCVIASRRAVQDAIGPQEQAEEAPGVPVWSRIVRHLPDPAPSVTVLVHAGRSGTDLSGWLQDLKSGTAYPNLDIRVAEAGDLARAAASGGDLLLLLDAGLLPVDPLWLRELASQALRQDIGAVGAKLVSHDGVVLHAGYAVGGSGFVHSPFQGRRATDTGYFGHLQLARSVTAVSSACMMLRRQVFLDMGGLDTAIPLPWRDIDAGLRLRQMGLRTLWTPFATLRGDTHALARWDSPGGQDGLALLRQRWGDALLRDPYWNPNLSTTPGELQLAVPPQQTRAPLTA